MSMPAPSATALQAVVFRFFTNLISFQFSLAFSDSRKVVTSHHSLLTFLCRASSDRSPMYFVEIRAALWGKFCFLREATEVTKSSHFKLNSRQLCCLRFLMLGCSLWAPNIQRRLATTLSTAPTRWIRLAVRPMGLPDSICALTF